MRVTVECVVRVKVKLVSWAAREVAVRWQAVTSSLGKRVAAVEADVTIHVIAVHFT